jgi:hypothetical protein
MPSRFDFSKIDRRAKIRVLDDFVIQRKDQFLAFHQDTAYRMKIPHEAACPICIRNYETDDPVRVPYGKSMGFMLNAVKPRDPREYVSVVVQRKHRKRSNQTEAYHRKVQKRWDKRGLKVTKLQEVMDPILVKISQSVMNKLMKAFHNKHHGVKIEGPDLHLDLDKLGVVFGRKRTEW